MSEEQKNNPTADTMPSVTDTDSKTDAVPQPEASEPACTQYGIYTNLMAFYKITEARVLRNKKEYDAYSHLYGYTLPAKDVSPKYDERFSENSILKHSPYFARRRKIRDNTETYFNQKFFPERFIEEYPLMDEKSEIIHPAVLEIGKGFKKIRIKAGVEIEIHDDGYVMIFDIELKPHSIVANTNNLIYDVSNEFTKPPQPVKRRLPDTYIAILNGFSDTLGPNGGRVTIDIMLSRERMPASTLSVELDVYKIPDDMLDGVLGKSDFPVKRYSSDVGCLS